MAGYNVLRILDDPERGCWIDVQSPYLDAAEADQLLVELISLPWQRPLTRGIAPRRGTLWFAAGPAHVYRFSGHDWRPQPLRPGVSALAVALSSVVECQLNSVLATYYSDGAAGVAWHDDDDFPGARLWPIALVSLGAARRLAFRVKGESPEGAHVDLESGSLLMMGGATQRYYQHAVRPTSRAVGPRVSLSFRPFSACYRGRCRRTPGGAPRRRPGRSRTGRTPLSSQVGVS